MVQIPSHTVICMLPHAVNSSTPCRYRVAMGSKATLTTNTLSLIRAAQPPLRSHETGLSRLTEMGFAMGTAQRVLDASQDVRLSSVDRVAECFEVEPWQLLVPGMSPEQMPQLAGDEGSSLSPRALDIAHRLDALVPDVRLTAYALMDQALQMAEAAQRQGPTPPPPQAGPGGGHGPGRGPHR
jgi:hypothetical protein